MKKEYCKPEIETVELMAEETVASGFVGEGSEIIDI